MRTIKRIMVLCLFLLFVLKPITTCSAYPTTLNKVLGTGTVEAGNAVGFFTTQPPHNSSIMNGNYKALNVFATTPYASCPVTTYTYSGSETQGWRERTVPYGNEYTEGGLVCYTVGNYSNLVLQIRRLGSTPEVNISTLLYNYARDVEILKGGETHTSLIPSGWNKLTTEPRSNHTVRMYITLGSAMSNYPGNYLYWESSYSGALDLYMTWYLASYEANWSPGSC